MKMTHVAMLVASLACGSAVTAQASMLTTNLAVDDGYVVYISTSDTVLGTQFGAGQKWSSTYTDTTTLAAGQDYFLHIYGYDKSGLGGLMGSFALSGTDHQFANGSTNLDTDVTNWLGNTTGFSNPLTAVTVVNGQNGVGPWGTRPQISSGATWIWSGDAYNNDAVYLSTKITAAVPEPETYALMLAGLGVVGALAGRRQRR